MSRTYRKSKYNPREMDYRWKTSGISFYGLEKTPEADAYTVAIHKVRGDSNDTTHFYMNSISRVRRTNDRKQLSQVDITQEFCTFDDSKHIKKRKEVWLLIY